MGSLGRAAGRGVEGDKVPYQRIQAWNFTTGKPVDLPVPELCSFSAVTQDGEYLSLMIKSLFYPLFIVRHLVRLGVRIPLPIMIERINNSSRWPIVHRSEKTDGYTLLKSRWPPRRKLRTDRLTDRPTDQLVLRNKDARTHLKNGGSRFIFNFARLDLNSHAVSHTNQFKFPCPQALPQS